MWQIYRKQKLRNNVVHCHRPFGFSSLSFKISAPCTFNPDRLCSLQGRPVNFPVEDEILLEHPLGKSKTFRINTVKTWLVFNLWHFTHIMCKATADSPTRDIQSCRRCSRKFSDVRQAIRAKEMLVQQNRREASRAVSWNLAGSPASVGLSKIRI